LQSITTQEVGSDNSEKIPLKKANLPATDGYAVSKYRQRVATKRIKPSHARNRIQKCQKLKILRESGQID
jgi:hypothetical protein